MFKYVASEKYKRDKRMIHFVLIAVSLVIILVGVCMYFFMG